MADDVVASLSHALRGGEFSVAEELLAEYCEQLQASIGFVSDVPSKIEIVESAVKNLRLWLSLSLVLRSHLSGQLRQVRCERTYAAGEDSMPTFQIAG
jgi:hypothetical protein